MKLKFIPGILFVLLALIADATRCYGQDDLLIMLQLELPRPKEKVLATFKGDKVINVQTNETVKKDNLDFRVGHLFGNVGKESGGGIHNLYGLHQSADIRIGFHYGLSDRLMVGVSSLKRNENFEGLVKFRLLEQTTDNSMPFAITLLGNATYSIKESEMFTKNVYRLTYLAEAIIARKFSSDFSCVIAPAFLHRNFVNSDDENNTFSLSAGFRYRFTRSASIIADYSHTFGRDILLLDHFDAIGAGIEIETGGHVFSIMFTNASGILENDFLVNTYDSWGKGGFKFCFNISRMFKFGKEDPPGK